MLHTATQRLLYSTCKPATIQTFDCRGRYSSKALGRLLEKTPATQICRGERIYEGMT